VRGDALARVIAALEAHGCKGKGSNWCCPAHEDKSPSLSVNQGDAGAMLKCHAGCEVGAVVAAVGLGTADLFDEPRQTG
jgi:hypothetical protein